MRMKLNSFRRGRPRRSSLSRIQRRLAPIELLEPRLPLSASPIDDRPYIDVGPSDNVAWDQPRVTVQLLTEDFPDGAEPPGNIIVGPNTFNSWLLDTGANTTLGFQTAVVDMNEFSPTYETDGKFNELGVGGVTEFDVSLPYRFDFAGSSTFERNKLLESRMISDPSRDLSIFGPWGIVGMPAMTERVTTVDFTPWTSVQGFDLFMQTDFNDEVPAPLGPRYTLNVDNRVSFSPEESVVSGPGIPMWADLPFFSAELKNNESLTEGNFLFDTGAQVSIISTRMAFDLGLDSNNDGVLNSLDSNFARSETIGGISGQLSVPVFLIDEVHVRTSEGPDLVWTDLQWIILDIVEGIDGVFGFDNMTSGWIEAFGIDGQSGYILQSHFDFRGWDTSGEGKIHFDFNEEYFTLVDPLGPGAFVTESGDFTTVTENNVYGDTYQIRLSKPPIADVRVTFVGNAQVGAVDAAKLNNNFVTFTPDNWDVPQTVLVQAVNDGAEEGYHRAFIRNVSTSSDPNYDGVGMPRVSVGIVDDDFAGMMIIPTDGDTRVTEGGEPDYYDVVLMTPPTEDVFVIMQHVANQVEVVSVLDNSPILTFTPTNWNLPQRVRVTAIDDTLPEPLLPAYIAHVIASGDENYQQAFALQEKAFVRDNDGLDQIGPRVTNVILGSSSWSPGFIDLVDGDGTGAGNGLGVSMTGAGQLANLPWTNLDKIYLQFDEDVSADFNAANVQVTGANVGDYMSGVTMAYGVNGENVGTLTFANPIAKDILSISLSDKIRDLGGNPLDGEWTNAVSLVSGNGTNGGGFDFRIDALPGDVDDSGGVNLVDVFDVYDENGSLTTSTALSRLDVDGSGGINLVDLFAVYNRNGTILPDPPSGDAFQSSGDKRQPNGDASRPGQDLPAAGEVGGTGGLVASAWLDGFGGVRQATTAGGRLDSALDQINPFLRRSIRRAEMLAEQFAPTEQQPALLARGTQSDSIGSAAQLSVPSIDSVFAGSQDHFERAIDDTFASLDRAYRSLDVKQERIGRVYAPAQRDSGDQPARGEHWQSPSNNLPRSEARTSVQQLLSAT